MYNLQHKIWCVWHRILGSHNKYFESEGRERTEGKKNTTKGRKQKSTMNTSEQGRYVGDYWEDSRTGQSTEKWDEWLGLWPLSRCSFPRGWLQESAEADTTTSHELFTREMSESDGSWTPALSSLTSAHTTLSTHIRGWHVKHMFPSDEVLFKSDILLAEVFGMLLALV